jgi:hydroxyacylglutathione hydrolase
MKITDSIYLAASGSKWGFGITHELDCNVYLIDTGSGCILIDAGAGLETEKMDAVIHNHGYELTDIKKIILTHYHGDHACGASRIQQAAGCQMYAPAAEALAIQNGDETATSVALAKGGLYPADFIYPKSVDVAGLHEGDTVTLGSVTLTAYMVPGHSLCDMVLYGTIDGRKCLFTGDAVFVCGQVLIQSLPDVSLYPYACAMKRLAALDIDALFPGHGVFVLEHGSVHVKKASDAFQSGLIPPQLYYFV